MSANQEAKKAVVEEIKSKLENAQSAVVVDYRGLTVEEVNKLRSMMREANVEYKIYKNTMMDLAIKGTEFEGMSDVLAGPSAFAFGYDDAVAPARVLNGFMKETKKMQFKAGVIEGTFYDEEKIKEVAMLPSKEELIAKLLGSMKAPLSNFAYMLQAIVDNPDCLNNNAEAAEAVSEEPKEEENTNNEE
ncbi:MAG: 50S ribosomal protein L10 [Clostridia bacterium]|nr:50S ribosomal protein L10 [Clostridia bacterium]